MHPCLLVPELVYHIFQFTKAPTKDDDYGDPLPPSTHPLSLTLTCHTFLDPGLDLVWYQIPSIDAFENCLPARSKPLVSSDWDRFDYYARRVRRFGSKLFARNSAAILSQITLARPLTKILPNLRELRIYARDILDKVDFFVGKHLKVLKIVHHDLRGTRVSSSIFQIQSQCASIERFVLTDCFISKREAAALATMVGQFTSLKSVQWSHNDHDFPEDTLVQLASFPLLETISVSCPLPPSQSYSGTHGLLFNTLKCFIVHTPTLDNFMARLELVSSTQLSAIAAQLRVDPVASQLQAALTSIRDRLVHATDAEVEVVSDEPVEPVHGAPMPAETLHPLLSLPNLTVLRLCFHCPVDVDDVLLKTMATAWPRLRTLELIRDYWTSVPFKITLPGLAPLAERCTQLTECSLLLDGTTLPADCFTAAPGRYVCPVQRIFFGDSPLTDASRVAAFLSDLFPQLRDVEAVEDSEDEGDKWEDVDKLVSVFREVRRQEREIPPN